MHILDRYISAPPDNVSDFAKDFNFEDLRPYYDSEAVEAMKRIAYDEIYHNAMSYIFPEMTKQEMIDKALSTKSPYEFQVGYMYHAIWKIVKGTSAGLTYSGIEHLDKNKAYLYVANHRDILLDSAILQIILDKEGFSTTEITFGSNLMESGFKTDFGKMNRMFAVKREGTSKELYDISRQLSAYIRHTIIDKKNSVWIAQRNGRTKDGHDLTQTGLLKMLNMSGNKDFESNFKELSIVPLTISYEYEPCDTLKVQENYYSSLHSKYVKAEGEDLNSILTGIKQQKGKIHVAFGKPIEKELQETNGIQNDNEKIKYLTSVIDKQIYQNYQLCVTNYIACDLLKETTVFDKNYSASEKENFIQYMENQIAQLKGEHDVLRTLFLKLYAMPLINKL